MSAELFDTILTGLFAVGCIVIGSVLTHVSSYFQHKRQKEDDRREAQDREHAVFHGAFALANFIAEKLIEWDGSRNVYTLARLTVAQPYLAKLIDRSPPDSERLMVSLIDLGLRLEALMYSCGFAIGAGDGPSVDNIAEIEQSIEELGGAVEVVQIILNGELPFMSDEELSEFPLYRPNDPPENET